MVSDKWVHAVDGVQFEWSLIPETGTRLAEAVVTAESHGISFEGDLYLNTSPTGGAELILTVDNEVVRSILISDINYMVELREAIGATAEYVGKHLSSEDSKRIAHGQRIEGTRVVLKALLDAKEKDG